MEEREGKGGGGRKVWRKGVSGGKGRVVEGGRCGGRE